MTIRGRYIGKRRGLLGKTALLREDPRDDTRVLVQFDDRVLRQAYGWWPYRAKDFEFVREVNKGSTDGE